MSAETPKEVLLASIDNALRNGSFMTNANLAFEVLCDQLDVDRDALEFQPGWLRDYAARPTPTPKESLDADHHQA